VKKDGSDEVGRAAGEPNASRMPARRYDSFHLRVWSRPGDPAFLRIDVRHLQTDLVEHGTGVSAVWLVETLVAIIAAAPPEQAAPAPI
jgi:hypothetical protein